MKTKTLLFSFCLFFTGTLLAQTTVTWGESNSRTNNRDNAGQYGSSVMSGFYQTPAPVSGTYAPGTSNPWMHLLDIRHSNPANNYSMQFAGSYFDQNLYFIKTNNWSFRHWQKAVLENLSGQAGINIDNALYKLDVSFSTTATNLFSPTPALGQGNLAKLLQIVEV